MIVLAVLTYDLRRSSGLRIFAEGFPLHAGVSVSEVDGDALEQLARYCARPPLSLHRIAMVPDGQILYRAKHTTPGTPGRLHLSPTQFLGRMAALIPQPRSLLLRYRGVFAPLSKHRGASFSSPPRQRPLHHHSWAVMSRLDGASLLRLVFAFDVLHCERCGGRRLLLFMSTEAKTAQFILGPLSKTDHPRYRRLITPGAASVCFDPLGQKSCPVALSLSLAYNPSAS